MYIYTCIYVERIEVDNVSDFVLYCKILESFNEPTDSIDQNSIVTWMIILQRKDLDSENPNIAINWRTPFLCREINTLTTEIVEIYVVRNGRRLTEERTTRDSVRKTRFFFKTYDISSEYWLAKARHFRSLASRIPEHPAEIIERSFPVANELEFLKTRTFRRRRVPWYARYTVPIFKSMLPGFTQHRIYADVSTERAPSFFPCLSSIHVPWKRHERFPVAL